LSDPTRLDEAVIIAWALVKRRSGQPDEAFTDRDRQMFELGYAACLADVMVGEEPAAG
jgi:hypothetical protein